MLVNFCLVGVVIALPQKRSGESNGALADNTKELSFFGIRDYLGNYCPSLPCNSMSNFDQVSLVVSKLMLRLLNT